MMLNKREIVEKKLLQVFKLIFKLKDKKKILEIKKNNFTKWDSLNHIKLMIYIENDLDIKFGVKKFNEVDSFKKILNFLIKKKNI